jgi:hypothetical protein
MAADAPLPAYESYSSLTTYEACPRRYAFRYVERLPGEVAPGQFAFGNAVHKAFERFVRERIRARAEGAPDPGADLLRLACDEVLERAGLKPAELATARIRATPVLARFLDREASSVSTPVAAELGFGVDVAVAMDDTSEARAEARRGPRRATSGSSATSTASTAHPTGPPRSSTTRPGGPAARLTSTPIAS